MSALVNILSLYLFLLTIGKFSNFKKSQATFKINEKHEPYFAKCDSAEKNRANSVSDG